MTAPASPSRIEICRRTAAALRAAEPGGIRAVIGFDGFVDNIMRAVDRRLDAAHFEPVATIAALGRRIAASAGHSSNLELVQTHTQLGGNGPIFASALATLGADVTYVGSLGHPTIHPVFDDFARRARLHSIADPGVTDALEFDDGKLMLNKNQTLADVTWANLSERVGLGTLTAAYERSTLIGMANWTMLPHLSDIWRQLLAEVMPKLSGRPRQIFVDLADPAKRTDADLTDALALLGAFQRHGDVVLGLNIAEGLRVAALYDLGRFDPPAEQTEALARAIRDKLGLSRVVIHTRHGAAAATGEQTAAMVGPFVRRPVTTTGAGDHFNSGFTLGLGLNLGLAECLCCGVAVGGYYVSRGKTPTLAELIDFIARLPGPEDEATPA